MKRLMLAVSVILLAGCVDGSPVTPDTFCPDAPADTVMAGEPWYGVVVSCVPRPEITTGVRK